MENIKINKKYSMNKGQYFESEIPKSLIFLHHSAGTSAKSAIAWWNHTPARIGTALLVDRDGTIFQTMDPKLWAYHLGVNGDNDYLEKASIGIEIVAAGRVHKEGDKYMFYPMFPKKINGREIPKEEVITIKEGRWKGTFQKYTDAQVESVTALVKALAAEFKIKIQKDFSEQSLEFNKDIWKKKLSGLYSHSTVRQDKIDILPQPNLIEALQTLI